MTIKENRTELVAGGRVEKVFTEPTYDDLAKLFEDLDKKIQRVEMIFTEPTYDDLAKLFEDLGEKIQRVEMIFTEPTYDDLAKLFEDLDEKIQIEEERAENLVDNMKSHKANIYGKCI